MTTTLPSLLLTLACAGSEPVVSAAPMPQVAPVEPAAQPTAQPPALTPELAPLSAPAGGFQVQALAPDQTVDGVSRQVLDLAEGWEFESPAVAVSSSGELFAAFVSYAAGQERIELRRGADPQSLGAPQSVSKGSRAWAPVLVAGPDGSVWLAWSGRSAAGERSTLSRKVLLRRVDRLGPILELSAGPGRAANPDLAVDSAGVVHVVWEQDVGQGVGIAYAQVSGGAASEPELLSKGWLDRRPSVAVDGERVHVAWDSLVTRAPQQSAQRDTPSDPDYDLRLRTWAGGKWGRTQGWRQPGIQAAPDLAVAGDRLLVAFHDSRPQALVKWVGLLEVSAQGVRTLGDPMAWATASGEQQGAEFPSLVVTQSGGVVVVTRSSQGAYLHVVGAQGFSTPLDLTRYGWGARGQKAQLALSGDTLYAARKARKASVLEQLTLPALSAPQSGWQDTALETVGDLGLPSQGVTERLQVGGREVYLGDVHMHSAMSDATGPADEIYARAWSRGLDFATLTDHDYVIGSRMLPSEHEEQAWLTELFGRLPGFVTLHAYEWTTPLLPKGSGHRNLYFKGWAPTPILGFKDGAPDTKALNQGLAPEQVFSVPHHTSWTGTDWENFDPRIQRNFEIVSVHGLSEQAGDQVIASRGDMSGMFAYDGLGQGLDYGFVAGSDGHGLIWHHGIARRPDPWTQGLTGVLAEQGTREGLWEALYDRHTCATSGAPMGAVLTLSTGEVNGTQTTATGPLSFTWEAAGSRTLQEIHILRDGQVVHRVAGDSLRQSGSWTDSPPAGDHFYVLRVVQAQDQWTPDAAWSSPIFVTVPN
ncbi:MAG: hypothetical protein VX899_23575 [Myxococcota bacterium]|nr:hypothetical protein [Myxococcota bacterium]